MYTHPYSKDVHPLENIPIALATLVFGIMAGFFWTYSFNVNLAMLEVEGQTYAIMQSLFNQNVRHPMFFLFFFGGGIFSIIALFANSKHWKSVAFLLLATASLVYIFGVIVFTSQINLPLNYYTESWNPSSLPSDWQTTRDQWNSANNIRVITSGLAFILGLSSLVIRSSVSIQKPLEHKVAAGTYEY